MSGKGYIAVEPNSTCELCGKYEETRPYGPNGERICFDCGMKQPEITARKMREYIYGEYSA